MMRRALSALARFSSAAGLGMLFVSGMPMVAAADSIPETPVNSEPSIRPVVSVTVISQNAQVASYYGQIAAKVVADLGFAQAGELQERPVRRGDVVKAGDLLAALDPTDLNNRLRAAEAQFAVANAQVAQASDLEARTRSLAARGTANTVQLDSATLARVAADAAVSQASAGLASVRDLLATSRLLAPDGGVILASFAEPGANLVAGQPVVQLASLTGREVLIDLTDAELAQIAADARFQVKLDANLAISAVATVASVDPVADSATRTRRVHLGVVNPPEQFRIGALTRVTQMAEPGQARRPIIPTAALLTEGDASYVWRVERPSGRVSRTKVTTEAGPNGYARVLAGVVEGDEVVVRGIHSLSDGQIVGPQVSP